MRPLSFLNSVQYLINPTNHRSVQRVAEALAYRIVRLQKLLIIVIDRSLQKSLIYDKQAHKVQGLVVGLV